MVVINEWPGTIYEADTAPLYIAEAPEPYVPIPPAPAVEQPAFPLEAEAPEVLDAELAQPPGYPQESTPGSPVALLPQPASYQPYPYASGPGLLRNNTAEPGVSSLVELGPSVGLQDGLRAALLDVRWLLESRLEIPAGVVGMWEQDAWAVLSRAGIGYRFFQGSRLFARVEAGGRFWLDDVEPVVGCYGGLGFTAYVLQPVTLDLGANYGVVGDARVFEGSAFVGMGWKRVALRMGYRALYVDEVSLSSPMIGIGVWL